MGKETKSVVAAGAVFLVLVLGALYYLNEQQTKLEKRRADIASLEKKIAALRAEAATRDALVAQLDDLRANLAQYVKILPSPEVATEERLMELVQEKCDRTQFELVRYSAGLVEDKAKSRGKKKKGAKKRGGDLGGFTEIGVTLQAEGTYEQFLKFLNSLERHESFLRVNSFACSPGADATTDAEGNSIIPLRIDMSVSTFRYDTGGAK